MNWDDKAAADRPDHINIYIEHFGAIPKNHHIHHIDNDHENNDPRNLIALPRGFHKNIHSDYAFYYNIASSGMVNKELLQALLRYYAAQRYSLNKRFSKVLVEFLLSKYTPNFKKESLTSRPKAETQCANLLKRVRGALAPYYKQNDMLFGSNGIYSKLSEKQIKACFEKTSKMTSDLYLELKKGRL